MFAGKTHWKRGLLSACLCLTAAFAPPVPAAPAVAIDAPASAAYPAPFDALLGMDNLATVEQVAAAPADAFQPLVPNRVYPVSHGSPLWLRLRLSAGSTVSAPRWLLEFPISIVDRWEFYQRDAKGLWQMQAAGDTVAHRQWPLNGLRPRFALTATGAGEQDVYVRVVQRLPVSTAPQILTTQEADADDAQTLLWIGLLMGVVGTLILTCIQMTLAYRDRTYAWYAGYLFFTLLSVLSYSGVAQRAIWPDATKFASDAVPLTMMFSFAFNLQFSRAMFGSWQRRRFHALARLVICACLLWALLAFFTEQYEHLILSFHALVLSVFGLTLYAALHAWRRGAAYGGYWLMIYVPYLLGIGLSTAESTGLVAVPWYHSELPILATMLEAVAMMFCINAYGRLRHAQAVREEAASERDPLTGFLHQSLFHEKARHSWDAAAISQRDVAVVYVLVNSPQEFPPGAVQAEAQMARSVRHVRTITHERDVVGRLGRNLLGIVMTDAPTRDVLSNRLGRLVALGLMQDAQGDSVNPLQFDLAAGSRRSVAGSFDGLDAALRELLAKPEQPRKPIRFLSTLARRDPTGW